LREIAFVAIFEDEVKVVGGLFDIIEFNYVFVIAGLQHSDFIL
jgi:hypothetical protein